MLGYFYTLSLLTLALKSQCQSTTPFLDYCQLIPYNKITSCNTTCATCKSQSQCLSCPSYLQLVQSSCRPYSNNRIYYKQYFQKTTLKFDNDLQYFSTPLGMLSSDNVFRFCIANNYRFDVIGLFATEDEIQFTQTYFLQAESIALNFRIFFSTSLAIVKVQINSKMVYNVTLDSGFTLNFTKTSTPEVQSNTDWDIGIISDNPIAYVDRIFAPVRTGMLPLSNTTASIKITVQSGQANGVSGQKFWGISEISIVTKQCTTCVSEFIIRLSSGLGIVIGISAGIVAILVLALYIYNKINQVKNRKRLRKNFDQAHQKAMMLQRGSNRLTNQRPSITV